MMTLIATVLGFFGSIIPQGMKIYQDSKDKKHELDILRIQADLQREGHYQRLEEVAISHDAEQQAAMYRTFFSGIKWIDALNALVRPVLTFSFFGLYVYIKYMQYSFVSDESLSLIMDIMWASEDQALFSSIIAFYFGNRTFNKLLNRRD